MKTSKTVQTLQTSDLIANNTAIEVRDVTKRFYVYEHAQPHCVNDLCKPLLLIRWTPN